MKKITNKEVLQSYILTSAKYDYSVYEKRILYRLIELAQSEIEGLDFSKDCRKIEHDLFGLVTVTLPISSILANETDKNHKIAKDALTSLSQKYLIYEDDKVWEKLNIVVLPKIQKRSTTFTCTLDPRIWDVILNFSKGFRKFELKTAMTFDSVYSMRFYELMSGQKEPLIYTIDALKEMFQIQSKYHNVNDFIRKVIVQAKKELDAKSPYSFDFQINKRSQKFHSITFFPILVEDNKDEEFETIQLQKSLSPSWIMDRVTLNYLKQDFGFTTKEIQSHYELFKEAFQAFDLPLLLTQKKRYALAAKNPKGYIINMIRNKLEEAQK